MNKKIKENKRVEKREKNKDILNDKKKQKRGKLEKRQDTWEVVFKTQDHAQESIKLEDEEPVRIEEEKFDLKDNKDEKSEESSNSMSQSEEVKPKRKPLKTGRKSSKINHFAGKQNAASKDNFGKSPIDYFSMASVEDVPKVGHRGGGLARTPP